MEHNYKLKMQIKNSEIYLFLEQELRKITSQILPNEEKKLLPPIDSIKSTNSLISLLDYIFVIDKFINSSVLPIKWEIIKSDSYNDSPLKEQYKRRLSTLENILKTKDIKINSLLNNYLPKSRKKYFETYYNDQTKRRYFVDFTNSFFGIKHFHLSQDYKVDDLLFYATYPQERKIYFLYIGKHEELYTKTVLETIINNYPNLMKQLDIMELSGIHPGNNENINEVKGAWMSGNNVSFNINNKVYYSMPQSMARINLRINQILSNIIYQIETQTKEYLCYLNIDLCRTNRNYQLEILKPDENFSLQDGVLYIKERQATIGAKIFIDYLQNLKVVNILLHN